MGPGSKSLAVLAENGLKELPGKRTEEGSLCEFRGRPENLWLSLFAERVGKV